MESRTEIPGRVSNGYQMFLGLNTTPVTSRHPTSSPLPVVKATSTYMSSVKTHDAVQEVGGR